MTTQWARSPRKRRRVTRTVMYLLLAVAVGIAVVGADWETIQRAFFDPEIMRAMIPDVITIGIRNTLIYTVLSFAIGLTLALILALMKLSAIGPYRWFATAYIELFRGLPALVTIILVVFAIPIAFEGADNWIPGGSTGRAVVGLSLVAAAYMAETLRAGIEAVPKGQTEAARSLGMPATTAMASIVLPQAFRIIIPPLTNELVLLIKDTSLFFVAGTTPITKELTKLGRDLMSTEFNGTPLTVVAIAYLVITLPLTFVVSRLEKRTARAR